MDGNSGAWSGWIAFAGLLMVVIGSLDFFAGLVAIINDRYYTVTRDQMVLIHDVSHWGWVTLLWGIVIVLAGFGLLAGSGWARWFAIVVGTHHVLREPRLAREHRLSALDADRADPERRRPLRADGALELCEGRPRSELTANQRFTPSRRSCMVAVTERLTATGRERA